MSLWTWGVRSVGVLCFLIAQSLIQQLVVYCITQRHLSRLHPTTTTSGHLNTIVLAGPPRTGKTKFFHQLQGISLDDLQTVTSVRPNKVSLNQAESKLQVPFHHNGAWSLLDLPGHPKLKAHLKKALNSAALIVTVIDASHHESIEQAASLLFCDILSHATVKKYATPVIVAFNKIDLVPNPSLESLENTLTLEMQRLKRSKVIADESEAVFGYRPFSFKTISNPIHWICTSLRQPDSLESLVANINKLLVGMA